jgi:predicted O-methyltransferase YrrM
MLTADEIHAAVLAPESSLNKHYWTLFSMALGVHAQSVFEFGAGGSSAVLLTALELTGGRLTSCDTEPLASLAARLPAIGRIQASSRWTYCQGRSQAVLADRNVPPAFDLALHDGSHERAEVADDVAEILPRLKQFGLLLVHDVEQFELGEVMRSAVMEGIVRAGLRVSMTSLPYSDGLAIIRMESERPHGTVRSPWCKSTTRPPVLCALPWKVTDSNSLFR